MDGIQRDEAAESLRLIQAQRDEVADRWVGFWWWHPLLGLLYLGFIASLETHSKAVILPAEVIWIAAQGLLVAWYTRRTGLFLAHRNYPQAAVRVTAMYVGIAVAVGVAWVLERGGTRPGPFIAAGVIAFVLWVTLGPRIEAKARQEIRSGR